jgi:hypothetical protein
MTGGGDGHFCNEAAKPRWRWVGEGGIQLLGAGIGKGKEGKKSHASLGPINEEGTARQATKLGNNAQGPSQI